MRKLSFLFLFAACASPEQEATPLEVVDPNVERMPEIRFSPVVWETVGNSLEPQLQLVQPFDAPEVELSFRYTGPADMQLPEPVTLSGFQLTEYEPVEFSCVPEGIEGEGLIEVVYGSRTQGEVVVGSLPVVHTQSIVKSVEFQREDALAPSGEFEASFVVVVHLDPPSGPWADVIRETRSLDLMASVEAQVGFAPEVQSFTNVSRQTFPGLPGHISLDGDRFVVVVSVPEREQAPMRRPFVKVEAKVGGDREVEFLPLRF